MAPVGQAGRQALQVPQCARARLILGQRQVQVNLADEEIRAGARVDEIGVLADPAEAGIARERLLEDGRAVGECAIAERADSLGDAVAELLQTTAHELVIVASECVAGYIGRGRVGERLLAHPRPRPASSPCAR